MSLLPYTGKDLAKAIERLPVGSMSTREKFTGFVNLAFRSLAKTCAWDPVEAERHEEEYMLEVKRWRSPEAVRAAPRILGDLFVEGQSGRYTDVLGVAAAECGTLSDSLGQFFTPESIARAMARMTMPDVHAAVRETGRGFLTVQDPACGAGAMSLGMAWSAADQKADPGDTLLFTCVDISALCAQMMFIAAYTNDLAAVVVCGNSLTTEEFWRAYTPRAFPLIARGRAAEARPRQMQVPIPRKRSRPPAVPSGGAVTVTLPVAPRMRRRPADLS